MFFLNYNQQDATIFDYSFLKGSTCLGGSSAHHQENIVDEMELHEVPSHPRYQPAAVTVDNTSN